VVEKLVEETANNDNHLRHLISICEGNLNYLAFCNSILLVHSG